METIKKSRGRPSKWIKENKKFQCKVCAKLVAKPLRHMRSKHLKEYQEYKNIGHSIISTEDQEEVTSQNECIDAVVQVVWVDDITPPPADNTNSVDANVLPNLNLIEEMEVVDSNTVSVPIPVEIYNPYQGEKYVNRIKEGFVVPVLSPTWDEMQHYSLVEYVTEIVENKYKVHQKSGICKIIPPPEYKARLADYGQIDNMIIDPKFQNFDSVGKDCYKLSQNEYKPMIVSDYREICKRWAPPPPPGMDKEAIHWDADRLLFSKGLYGTDAKGSLFQTSIWNLNKLSSILEIAEKQFGDGKEKIDGLTDSYLYFGEWGTGFPLHAENMDVYSVNYLHQGEPKVWYTTRPGLKNQKRLEGVLQRLYPTDFKSCSAFHRHKQIYPCPAVLQFNEIECGKVHQNQGEFIITFPRGQHWGFNSGSNVAEAINFATERWLKEALENVDLCPPKCTYKDLTWDMARFEKDRRARDGDTEEQAMNKEPEFELGSSSRRKLPAMKFPAKKTQPKKLPTKKTQPKKCTAKKLPTDKLPATKLSAKRTKVVRG